MANFKHKLLMIDGHALTHRAFHALPNLSNAKGFPTGAVFGFFSMLFKALEDIKPTHVLVVFDSAGPTFRHTLAHDYKATRKPTPEGFGVQLEKIKEILRGLNIPIHEKPGYEADDILGIITRLSGKTTLNIIVTGDLDLLQLIDDNTLVYKFKTGFSDYVVYDTKEMKRQYGLSPEQWVDYKALRGDPSDNIPGVPGIGEKTGTELIKEFGTLDKVYAALDKGNKKIKQSVAAKLENGREQARVSHKLAHINCDLPYDFNLEKARISDYDAEAVNGVFQELGIRSLVQKLPKIFGGAESSLAKQKPAPLNFTFLDPKSGVKEYLLKNPPGNILGLDLAFRETKDKGRVMVGLAMARPGENPVYIQAEKTKTLPISPDLSNIYAEQAAEIVGHDLKQTAKLALDSESLIKAKMFDTQIASYVINPGQRSYQFKDLVFNYLGVERGFDYGGEEKPLDQDGSFEFKNEDAERSCWNAAMSLPLKEKLAEVLREKKLDKIFYEIESPLISILAKMELKGVALDSKWLGELSEKAGKEIKDIEKRIFEQAGREFNVASPIQLREVLFDELKIPTTEIRKKGKTGAISTAATELEKLRGLHPIIDLIFDYRELAKLKSTYLDALPELVSTNDGRIHTSFNQTIAATGRLSSSDPNLQNIPIRTELGRQVRKAFVAQKGFVLTSLDYSQIELRIAAALSKDPEMIKIFKAGKDFHSATAAKIFNVDEKEVTKDQRRDAKTINFSVLYGVSAFGLSERTEMGRVEAGEFIKRYYKVFGKLKDFIDETIDGAHKTGRVVNPMGRLRYFPEINSSNFGVRAAAERAAFNMPIQSLAADIIKMAMIKVDELCNEECRMILQVHDELVFEIKNGKEEDYIPRIKSIMESVYDLGVPVVAESKVGENWLEME